MRKGHLLVRVHLYGIVRARRDSPTRMQWIVPLTNTNKHRASQQSILDSEVHTGREVPYQKPWHIVRGLPQPRRLTLCAVTHIKDVGWKSLAPEDDFSASKHGSKTTVSEANEREARMGGWVIKGATKKIEVENLKISQTCSGG